MSLSELTERKEEVMNNRNLAYDADTIERLDDSELVAFDGRAIRYCVHLLETRAKEYTSRRSPIKKALLAVVDELRTLQRFGQG